MSPKFRLFARKATDSFVSALLFCGFVAGIAYAAAGWQNMDSIASMTSSNQVSSAGWNLIVSNLNDVNSRLSAVASVPSGAVMAFYLADCPSGWSKANGTAHALDLRGEYVRGLDLGRGVDPSRTLGSVQNSTQIFVDDDALQVVGAPDIANNSLSSLGYEPATYGSPVSFHWVNSTTGPATTPTSLLRSVRVRNVALLYCVKN